MLVVLGAASINTALVQVIEVQEPSAKVNSSSRLVHDNINLLKYLTCRLQNGKQSDSCSLSHDGGNSIDLRAGEVVLAADATCDQSSQVSQGS